MKWTRAVLAGIAMIGVTALVFICGCTSTSTRADLSIVSVNNGKIFHSDLINEADTSKIFIPVDQVVVRFANHPHDGSATVAPGTGFSEIDKAAKRGIIKNNTADRYKSRLSAAAKRIMK